MDSNHVVDFQNSVPVTLKKELWVQWLLFEGIVCFVPETKPLLASDQTVKEQFPTQYIFFK